MFCIYLGFGRILNVYMDSDPLATTNNTIANFIPTFESFLNREVNFILPGRNLSFKLHHYDGSISIDTMVAKDQIDFYFGGPNTAACLQSTYFASPILTTRKKKPGGGVIDGYGGVIIVSAGNIKINELEDLKGSIIGVQQQNGWASNILQQGVLSRLGINIFRDAKQACRPYIFHESLIYPDRLRPDLSLPQPHPRNRTRAAGAGDLRRPQAGLPAAPDPAGGARRPPGRRLRPRRQRLQGGAQQPDPPVLLPRPRPAQRVPPRRRRRAVPVPHQHAPLPRVGPLGLPGGRLRAPLGRNLGPAPRQRLVPRGGRRQLRLVGARPGVLERPAGAIFNTML